MRQERIRRVVELDRIIEEAIRESSQLRPHSPVLAMAVGGLLAAVASWRVVAVHFAQLPHDQARQEAATVLQAVPKELLSEPEREEPARWIADPIGLGSNGHRRIIGTQISGSVDKLRTLVCHITQTDNFVTS